MKIIIEQWNEKYEVEANGDEQDLDEMLDFFSRLLKSAGYVFDGELTIVENG